MFYMHQASIVALQFTQYEQYPLWPIHLHDINTNIQGLLNNGHKCYIVAQSQCIFYLHQVSVEMDHCAKYEQNHPIFLRYITTNTQFFLTFALIMDKCGAELTAILHASATHDTWSLQLWTKSTQSSLICQTNTHNVLKYAHNYSNVEQRKMLVYIHQQCMTPNRCTKYENNQHIPLWNMTNSILHAPVAHGTCSWYWIWRKSIQLSWRNVWWKTDGQAHNGWRDGQTDGSNHSYIPQFHYCGAGNNKTLIIDQMC